GALDLGLGLRDRLPDELRDLLGLLVGDPGHEGYRLSDRALRGRFDGARLKRLQRDLAPDGLLLEDLVGRLQAILGRRVHLDLVFGEAERRVGVLEVEALVDLAGRLVDGVADLLQIHLGHDVETGLCHGRRIAVPCGELHGWRPSCDVRMTTSGGDMDEQGPRTDAELLLAAGRDPDAFGELYDRHAASILRW